MRLEFAKMHGLGNDFVVINALSEPIRLDPLLIRRMSDRRRGIGCDQVLMIEAAADPRADFRYRIFNSDGSEAGQCGNGIRCVARFLYEQGLVRKRCLVAETPDRLMEVSHAGAERWRVNMGVPRLDPAEIPILAKVRSKRYEVEALGGPISLAAVSMGNPHAVIAVENVERAPVDVLGRALSTHEAFPEGVNVGFVEFLDRHHLRLRVFERGVGETPACGSGACAAVVVGRLERRLERNVDVELPGGHLDLEWEGEDAPVWMTGPAERVFEGTIEL